MMNVSRTKGVLGNGGEGKGSHLFYVCPESWNLHFDESPDTRQHKGHVGLVLRVLSVLQ